MTALCATLPTEWWTEFGDDGNRLAIAICQVCPGCPRQDPKPHGVIVEGVAYLDDGRPAPVCDDCGFPFAGRWCGRCSAPVRAWPADGWSRYQRVRVLASEGLNNTEIGARVGMTGRAVTHLRAYHGELAPHGTRAALTRHQRNNEPPCEPCRAAARKETS